MSPPHEGRRRPLEHSLAIPEPTLVSSRQLHQSPQPPFSFAEVRSGLRLDPVFSRELDLLVLEQSIVVQGP